MAKGLPKGEPMEIKNQTKSELNSEESFWWLKFVPQPNNWTNVNIFRFLRLYKTYPVLWDSKNPKYSKSLERSRAFGEISKKLNLQGVHEKECIKLVVSLKEIYIEEKQKREEAKSCMQKYKPPPVWFQVLNDIVEIVMNNEEEKEKSSSSINIKNEINKEQIKELIKCTKIHNDNIWTPNYLKTEIWKLFLPKTKSFVIEEEKDSKGDSEIANKDIDSSNQSCEPLKPLKPKYYPDHKNIEYDCSLHNIEKIKNYCPDFVNTLCDSSTHLLSIQSKKKYCPKLQNVLCSCSSESVQNEKKYCSEYKDVVCDCSSKTSSVSKIKENSDFRMPIQKVATPFTFAMPTLNKKKNNNPYVIELDRYCYYKDWSKYYKCKICDFKEYYQEPCQPEKDFDTIVSNQKPARPHKNNTVLESEINIFSDMNRYYPLQLFDCIVQENLNS